MVMRTDTEIKHLILEIANQDIRIRAVLLNGSKANPSVKSDRLQDYDLFFLVDKLESFTADHSWIHIFGEKIIVQLPDNMNFVCENCKKERIGFSYLMLFEDKNRIDLTLFPVQKFKSDFKPDSLTIIWLDKDLLFPETITPSDADYHIRKPAYSEFLEICNEFWWVSTYVAKGLLRKEIFYAKEMLETIVRPMFMRMIHWKVGVENNFGISTGTASKHLKKYLTYELYNKILLTYSNHEIEENWKAFFLMTELFIETTEFVAGNLGFEVNKEEEQNTSGYLKELFLEQHNY